MSKRLKAERLHGKRSTKSYRLLQPWMDEAAKLSTRFVNEYEDDPFAYNETASVSLLCSAAVSCGYIALSEFIQEKRALTRGRAYINGRWDFWMGVGKIEYGIEFKQIKSRFTPSRILDAMRSAKECARALDKRGLSYRYAGLIASLNEDGPCYARAQKNLGDFASKCSFAWRIDLDRNVRQTWIFLTEIK